MQKELTQQKTIQQQNKKHNTDVLTKTAPVVIQKERTDAEFDKMLRRPRSKKKLKLYAEVDLPSMTDEEIMERMRKERNSGTTGGSSWGESAQGENAQGENAQEEISKEDIESYLLSRQEEFIKMVQGEIREEEERKRREEEERKRREEEERKRREEERKNRKNGVLSKCCITGCYVHFIPFTATNVGADVSWNNVIHYKPGEVPAEFQRALRLYENCRNCNCVEIYSGRLAAIAASGEVIKIEKYDE